VGGHGQACSSGTLHWKDAERYVEVHPIQQDDGTWAVNQWAVQQPRAMLEAMIQVCKESWSSRPGRRASR
jgi:hypothetical protein